MNILKLNTGLQNFLRFTGYIQIVHTCSSFTDDIFYEIIFERYIYETETSVSSWIFAIADIFFFLQIHIRIVCERVVDKKNWYLISSTFLETIQGAVFEYLAESIFRSLIVSVYLSIGTVLEAFVVRFGYFGFCSTSCSSDNVNICVGNCHNREISAITQRLTCFIDKKKRLFRTL